MGFAVYHTAPLAAGRPQDDAVLLAGRLDNGGHRIAGPDFLQLEVAVSLGLFEPVPVEPPPCSGVISRVGEGV